MKPKLLLLRMPLVLQFDTHIPGPPSSIQASKASDSSQLQVSLLTLYTYRYRYTRMHEATPSLVQIPTSQGVLATSKNGTNKKTSTEA